MQRYSGNPILTPLVEHPWESREVFNPAVVYLNGKVHILYRAMGNDGISRIGYATSRDGYKIDERLSEPVYFPRAQSERDGCEDPRLSEVEGNLIMAYTALRNYSHLQVYQIALTTISTNDFLARKWNWTHSRLPFPNIRNKDAVIFPEKVKGRYVMLHRIEPDICIGYSYDMKHWCDIKSIMMPKPKGWDNWKIGVAGPPIKINEGWLLIYHGIDVDRHYSLGVALLDKDKPDRVIYRSKEHLIAPKEDYERFGKVPNVVFSCGNVIIGNEFFLYYGGADSVVCVATMPLDDLLAQIHR
ncbi:MAG: glycosidase [Candidatus Bathyarchaeota archaeon]|nr:glycosidase [Candidatus Bathyarchaeota archaeon]